MMYRYTSSSSVIINPLLKQQLKQQKLINNRIYYYRYGSNTSLATLTVFGPDRTGIVAASSNLLNRHGCTIVKSEHYTDIKHKLFFQRILFDCDCNANNTNNDTNTNKTNNVCDVLKEQVQILSKQLNMECHVDWLSSKKNVAIMVSKYDHCLWEILLRYRAKELGNNCNIALVISNHETCRNVAETFNIPYYVFPIDNNENSNKYIQEEKQIQLLQKYNIDVIVLARYMQILSTKFLQQYPNNIINIHHSFLPAFTGGKAYHQAHERGVKLIGATAHYATDALDNGPIIEQDVISVSHRDRICDYIRKGHLLERTVLVRALQAHLLNRIIVYNNKCVVFSD